MWQKIKNLLFHNSTTRQTVVKNAFWLAVANIGGRLIRSLIIIYSARVLGAAGWGAFSYAVSLVAFIAIFTDIGISPLLIRETAKARDDEEHRKKILSTSFILKMILLALGAIVIFFITPRLITIKEVIPLLPIVAFILAFDTLRDFGFYLIRAYEKMEWEAALYILTNVAIVAAGFYSLKIYKTVEAFAMSYAIGTGIGLIATIWLLRKNLSGILSNFSYKLSKSIFSSAWPFAVSSILGMLMLNTDILIIGWLRSAEDVGLYSSAQRIVQFLYLFPAILNTSLFPTFSRLANTDNEKLRKIFERAISFVFLLSIPMAIGGAILGHEITGLVFGSGYAKSTSSFQILLLTMLIDFPFTILSGLVFAYNKQKNIMLYSAIGGISNVLFDLILIPRFGILGSAFATLSAQAISGVYLRWAARKITHFAVFKYLKKVFAATALMAGVILMMQALAIHVVAIIIVATIAYFGMLLSLREPLFKEIKLILRPASSDAPPPYESAAL